MIFIAVCPLLVSPSIVLKSFKESGMDKSLIRMIQFLAYAYEIFYNSGVNQREQQYEIY